MLRTGGSPDGAGDPPDPYHQPLCRGSQGNDWRRAWRRDNTLKKPFKVRCVKLNGRKLPAGSGAWEATANQVEAMLPRKLKKFTLAF
jgi:hypothetical protein